MAPDSPPDLPSNAPFMKIFSRLPTLLWVLAIAQSAAAAPDGYVEGEVLVTFKAGLDTTEAAAALDKHALRFERRFDRISRRRGRVSGLVREEGATTAALIARLRKDSRIETVEPDYIRRVSSIPNDLDFAKLWGLRNTGQTLNGTRGTSGVDLRHTAAANLSRNDETEIVVGIIDTGVDIAHPDLASNIWINPLEIPGNGLDDDGNGLVDDVNGYDFALNDGNVSDSANHGTHVAGILAAVGENGIGVIGIDRGTKIVPLKVSYDGETMRSSAIIDAMNYALALKERGVNLVAINASYGGNSYSTSERNAIKSLSDAGIIVCAAAGNDGVDNDATPTYPASYNTPNIISVAALTQNNGLASFSNYGATSVDIAAPGVNIYSTLPLGETPSVASVTLGGSTYAATALDFSPTSGGVSGSVHDCGIGNPADFPSAVRGNIALIERGTLTFAEKVNHAIAAGATATIIYDNTGDALPSTSSWTLGGNGNWIPALQVTRTTGEALVARLPASGRLSIVQNTALAYQFLNGTSMATPYVAGAVALAARNFPGDSMTRRRARILDNATPVAAFAGKTVTGDRLDLLAIIDTDADGLPDWWEMEHFGTLAYHATDDSDGDGFSNLQEYISRTDPNLTGPLLALKSPVISLSSAGATSGRQLTLTFPTLAGAIYQIEWSATLADPSWQVLGSPVSGTGSEIEIIDPMDIALHPQRFYRLARIDR